MMVANKEIIDVLKTLHSEVEQHQNRRRDDAKEAALSAVCGHASGRKNMEDVAHTENAKAETCSYIMLLIQNKIDVNTK